MKVVPLGLRVMPADRAAGDHDRRHGATEGGAQGVDRLDAGLAVPELVVDDQQLRLRPAGAGRARPLRELGNAVETRDLRTPALEQHFHAASDHGIVLDHDDEPAVQRRRRWRHGGHTLRWPSAPPGPPATRA